MELFSCSIYIRMSSTLLSYKCTNMRQWSYSEQQTMAFVHVIKIYDLTKCQAHVIIVYIYF